MASEQPKQDAPDNSNTQKDPENWTTGDEDMTGAQASYLKTLSEQAGTEFNPELTKAEASMEIDKLQQQTGRGKDIAGGNPGNNPNPAEPVENQN